MNLPEHKQIKIPTHHYVGFQNHKDAIPLGFMIPEGSDSKSTARKLTVDSWAREIRSSDGADNKLPSKVLDNQPMTGFVLGKNIHHSGRWGKAAQIKWRIEDPRGFEMEISSPNLAQILSHCTIENGEILEKCVWGYLISENILIPANSEVYKIAVDNTKRLSKHASLKDLRIGNNVITLSGIEGTFLGSYYVMARSWYHKEETMSIPFKKRAFIGIKDHSLNNYSCIHIINTLKLSEIVDNNSVSIPESLDVINQYYRQKDNENYNYYNNVLCVLPQSERHYCFTFQAEEKLWSEIISNSTNRNLILVETPQGKWGLISNMQEKVKHNLCMEACEIDINQLLRHSKIKYIQRTIKPYYWETYSREAREQFIVEQNNPEFKFYFMQRIVKDKTGAQILTCEF